jgi:23S rRNA A1618 N6-methylase RlmF
MNKEKLFPSRYVWKLRGSLVDSKPLQDLNIIVQAESMEYAMEAVRIEHPDIRFKDCFQEDEIHLIVD